MKKNLTELLDEVVDLARRWSEFSEQSIGWSPHVHDITGPMPVWCYFGYDYKQSGVTFGNNLNVMFGPEVVVNGIVWQDGESVLSELQDIIKASETLLEQRIDLYEKQKVTMRTASRENRMAALRKELTRLEKEG